MHSKFYDNIISTYGNKGQQWLKELPYIVDKIAKEWNLTDLKPVDNLSNNYVLSGLNETQEIILKISLNVNLIEREKAALEILSGYGAVQILNSQEKALLLKKLSPATPLSTYLLNKKDKAIQIACEVVKKLHQAPVPEQIDLPSIEERFSLFDKDWPVSQDMLKKAIKCRNDILKKYSLIKVLHGDLHYDNILKDGNVWKVIDPHGVIGFPINDIWHLVQDIDKDIPFVANYFGFTQEDIIKCYFMHSLLAAIWSIEDNLDPRLFLDMAYKAYNLILL